MTGSPPVPADGSGGAREAGRTLGLGARILVGMTIGAVAGAVAGERALVVEPVGALFLRLLVLVAIPLIFFNLLAGLTALTDLRAVGRLARKIVGYYLLTDLFALGLGLAAMHLMRPGVGMPLTEPVAGDIGAVPSLGSVILGMVPTNVVAAFADGNVVQLVVVAVLLAVAVLLLPEIPRDRLRGAFDLLAQLFRRLVDVILRLAPIGIAALMAVTVGRYGGALFGPLARFLAGVWGAQLLMVVIYAVLLRWLADRSPVQFFRQTAAVWATTISTTSSLASLSVSLDAADRLKLPRMVSSFTLPLGAQINKDGTAIMLGAVMIFTAQAAGVGFTFAEHLTILFVGLLLSEGSSGIPGGGLVIALMFVKAFDLPLEVAAIVGGIYRLVDMGNTTVNVMGDLVGTCIVARSER